MADVLLREGKGYLRDPQSGAVISVPEAEVEQALAAGYQPATGEQFQGKRAQEEYGGYGGATLAALAGAGRGATLGLSDVLLKQLVDPETLSALRQANPGASGLGEAGGAIASMLIPGGPLAQVGKAGAALGKGASAGVARVLGQSSSRALPRLAGNLAREGSIGAAIGAGQGVSDVALDPGLLTPGESAARILSHAGKGAAWGGAIGGLSWLGQTGLARARDRYTLGMAEIKSLRGEKAALEAEQGAMQASGASGEQMARLEGQLSSVSAELHERQVGAIGKLFTRAAAYGIGHAIGGGVTGGLIGVLVAPRAMRALAEALEPLGVRAGELAMKARNAAEPYVEAAWNNVRQPVEAAWNRVAPYVERAAATSLGQAAIEVATPYVERAAANLGARAAAVTDRLGEKLGSAIAGIPDEVVTGALLGGAPGAVVGYAAHRLTVPVGRAVEVLTKKVAPAGKLALLESLTAGDWRDAAEEIGRIQPGQIDLAVRLGLPESTPPDAKAAVSQRLQAAAAYVQSLQPANPDSQQVPTAAAAREGARQGAKESVEAALKSIAKPETVVQSFIDETLTPEQIKAWEAVYPEALQQLRTMVDAGVERARARGGHFGRKRAEQIAILKGTPAAGPRLSQPAMVGRLQAMHRAARASRSAPRAATGRPLNISQNYMTPMQRIGSGGYK